jgi:hypothetical protein
MDQLLLRYLQVTEELVLANEIKEIFGVCLVSIMGTHQREVRESVSNKEKSSKCTGDDYLRASSLLTII